ncbi:MAG: HAD-IC family P-type ATPase [Bacilli bacterium]|nr:HAD-IC family P-type ATPase [Bacilli bacterium]
MKKQDSVQRANPSLTNGLTNEQVEERKKSGLVNKTKVVVGKTYFEIILTDVFSFFNILLFIVAGLMIAAQYWTGLTFLVVLIPNIGLSLYEDIKARHLMSKLRVLNQPKHIVIRNGEKVTVQSKDIVLDDVICLESGNQISVDGALLSGSLIVNESALTGESKNINKNPGDYLYSGSFVVSGTGCMHAEKIGEDSYIETIQSKAKKFKRSPSEILKTLTVLFRVIGCTVVTLATAIGIIYYIKGGFTDDFGAFNYAEFKESIKGISGSMISMIPAGLYLLSSVALAVAVLKLSKKGARVQDFYSVEMLAKTTVLCVDKTGTITDGNMDVKKVLIIGPDKYTTEDIAQIMSNLLHATKDNNLTAQALKKYFNYESTKGVVEALPFTSENKYSAASFKGGETYVLGAQEFLNITNLNSLVLRSEEYTNNGDRVLVLAKSSKPIKDGKVQNEVHPIALIVLQDHIRENAIETFKWFKENNVKIKVISGDDPKTVSHIASEVGIEGAERYISLAGLSDEEVAKIAPLYNIFGRVNPDQKEIIIQALKNEGEKVAMTGDGVNDILALKRADCSIAMNTGSEAAKNVSHIVLTDSNFNSLPSVVAEGRRVINNLQRTSSLFLVKTMFSVTTTLVFLVLMATLGIRYPFEATHFQLWSLINIGLSSFFLALEPNQEPLKGSFIGSILRKAVPGFVTILISVTLIYVMYIFQDTNIMYTGVYEMHTATTMSVIVFTILGLIVLLKICLPFNKYRALVFTGAAVVEVGLLIAAFIVSYKVGVKESIVAIDFPTLTLVNWFAVAIIIVLAVATYLIVSYVVEVLKGEHVDVKN